MSLDTVNEYGPRVLACIAFCLALYSLYLGAEARRLGREIRERQDRYRRRHQ